MKKTVDKFDGKGFTSPGGFAKSKSDAFPALGEGRFLAEARKFAIRVSAVELLLYGSANGAGSGASAAFDALVGVDHVLAIAFGDRVHGALGLASAAADAFVGNYVCHEKFTSCFQWQKPVNSSPRQMITRKTLHCKRAVPGKTPAFVRGKTPALDCLLLRSLKPVDPKSSFIRFQHCFCRAVIRVQAIQQTLEGGAFGKQQTHGCIR